MKAICFCLMVLTIASRAQETEEAHSTVAPTPSGNNGAVTNVAPASAPNPSLDNALCQAASKGDLAQVTSLLAQGANINNQAGWHEFTPILTAAGYKHWDLVLFLLSKGADPNLGPPAGTRPFSYVLQHDDQHPLALALVNAGENPNLCDTHYILPIVYVARSGDLELMKAFLAHHADVNLNGTDGPALWWAVGYDRLEMTRLLLDAGARIDIPATTDRAQRDIDAGEPDRSLLGLACNHDDVALIDLLVAHGVALNEIGENKRTPLTDAIVYSKSPTILHLLDKGVDPNQLDGYGQTPLMLAALYGYDPAVVQGLLDHGAKLDQANAAGQTALIFAAGHLQDQAVEYLVAHGANVNAVDKMGETALGYAGSRGDSDIPAFLSAHGATRTDVHIAARPPADPPLSPERAFGLAIAAMYPLYNGVNPHLLGFGKDDPQDARKELNRWWDVKDKASFFQAINDLESKGYGTDYRTKGAAYAQMSDSAFALSQGVSLGSHRDDAKAMRDSYLKWKDRSGLAWDTCRYINLISDGYAAGYIDANEAWSDILPAAQELQKKFSSWNEMADNFLDSRVIWNHGHDERFEKCLALLLDPKQASSVWNQIPWQTDLNK